MFVPLQLPTPRYTYQPPRDWLPRLRALIAANPRDDLASTEALCCRIVGDFTAGMVLHRLLYWMPRGSRADGAIWKSDREWYAELNLSYAQMQRVRARLAPLVKSWIEKARGAPTYHYQLLPARLLEGVATVLGIEYTIAEISIFERVENGLPANSKMVSRETRKSITPLPQSSLRESPHHTPSLTLFTTPFTAPAPTPAPVVVDGDPSSEEKKKDEAPSPTAALLLKAGLAPALAAQFDQLDPRAVQLLIHQVATKKNLRYPVAYLTAALKRMVSQATPVASVDNPACYAQVEPDDLPAFKLIAAQYHDPLLPSAESALANLQARQAAAATPAPLVNSPRWARAYAQLQAQFDRATWTNTLRHLRLTEEREGSLTFTLPTPAAAQLCAGRLYGDIRRIVSDAYGQPITLEFAASPVSDNALSPKES